MSAKISWPNATQSSTQPPRRADLISNLLEAPRKVAGHSRVVDIEKAIDSLEAAIDAAKVVLGTTEEMETRE